MKTGKGKKIAILLVIMLVIAGVSSVVTMAVNRPQEKEEQQITIVTSFYPVYIAALNVTKDVEHVKVVNLMEQQTGCLHDYTLSTNDMKKLETADVFILNGAGMEGYVEKVLSAYPELDIVDSSEGVELLSNTGEAHTHEEDADHEEDDHDHETEDADHEEDDHDHESEDADHEEEHDHDHGEDNAHIWMNPENYMKQVQNIAKGLAAADPEHADLYTANAEAYTEKVAAVWAEYKALPAFDYDKVIIFHDSVAYLANALGIEVPYSVAIDGDTALSAGDIATVIDEVKENKIKVLFSEEQFEDTIANRIAEETGAKVYVIDSMVTGEVTPDAYLEGMKRNLEVLKEALYQ